MDAKLADVRAIVYLRISEDRTGQEAGVQRQREDCERRCRDRGWQIVAVESDNDVSASGKRQRPGFEAMLKRVEAGEAEVVVAWALDRLQRNRRDEVRLYELCEKKGVMVSLVRGPDLEWQTPTGRYLADNLGSLARLEIEQKGDRQRRAQEQAAKAGRRVGGRRPFGYEQDGATVRPVEAEAIREGYAALLSGVSIAEIARCWNARGLTTGQAGYREGREGVPSAFTRSSVRDVLRNPRNAGLRAYKGEVIGQATWPRIVEESTWRAAVDLLRDPSRRTAPTNARALLTGVALCGVCGATVHSGGAAVTSKTRVYRCRTMAHFSRSADPVDDYVSAVTLARLQQPDAADLLDDTNRPDAGELRERAVALRVRLDSLAVDFAEGELTASQLRAATARLKEQLSEVESRLADAGKVDILGPLVTAEDVAAVWSALPVPRRRAVIDLLMIVTLHPTGRGTRTFRPETVAIEWRTA